MLSTGSNLDCAAFVQQPRALPRLPLRRVSDVSRRPAEGPCLAPRFEFCGGLSSTPVVPQRLVRSRARARDSQRKGSEHSGSWLHALAWNAQRLWTEAVLGQPFYFRSRRTVLGVDVRLLTALTQLSASMLFVVLYVWSTYQPPPRGSLRHLLDLGLSAAFAADFFMRAKRSGFWGRAVWSPLALLDLLSFLPGLMEAAALLVAPAWAALTALGGSGAAVAGAAAGAAAGGGAGPLAAWLASLVPGAGATVAAAGAGGAAAAGAAATTGASAGLSAAHVLDLRWFRIFRALRLLRLCLLTGNLPQMKLSRNALLSGSTNVRLLQLVASVLALLFTSASLVHLVERIPWHDALYFVTTTLTTVGYGDVVMKSTVGRVIVLAMMAVGVVLIPVRTSQLYGQLLARRVVAGALPAASGRMRPFVLLSGRLPEVRAFSDFFREFTLQLKSQPRPQLPRDVHILCLGNKPSGEFLAFQELNDAQLTLVEGSVLSPGDLVRCRAAAASAILVLGDRFTSDAEQEDLDVLFRVWAIKSYTKCVPLTVQVLRASALAKVAPFLDPAQDLVTSVEQTRHRLLALSALCPGASTLLANLLHTATPPAWLSASAIRPEGSPPPRLAGRAWFAEYVRGCGHDMFVVYPGPGLVGCGWNEAVGAAFAQKHLLLMGVLTQGGEGRLVLHPTNNVIRPRERLVVLAHSQREAEGIAQVVATPLSVAASATSCASEDEADVVAAARFGPQVEQLRSRSASPSPSASSTSPSDPSSSSLPDTSARSSVPSHSSPSSSISSPSSSSQPSSASSSYPSFASSPFTSFSLASSAMRHCMDAAVAAAAAAAGGVDDTQGRAAGQASPAGISSTSTSSGDSGDGGGAGAVTEGRVISQQEDEECVPLFDSDNDEEAEDNDGSMWASGINVPWSGTAAVRSVWDEEAIPTVKHTSQDEPQQRGAGGWQQQQQQHFSAQGAGDSDGASFQAAAVAAGGVRASMVDAADGDHYHHHHHPDAQVLHSGTQHVQMQQQQQWRQQQQLSSAASGMASGMAVSSNAVPVAAGMLSASPLRGGSKAPSSTSSIPPSSSLPAHASACASSSPALPSPSLPPSPLPSSPSSSSSPPSSPSAGGALQPSDHFMSNRNALHKGEQSATSSSDHSHHSTHEDSRNPASSRQADPPSIAATSSDHLTNLQSSAGFDSNSAMAAATTRRCPVPAPQAHDETAAAEGSAFRAQKASRQHCWTSSSAAATTPTSTHTSDSAAAAAASATPSHSSASPKPSSAAPEALGVNQAAARHSNTYHHHHHDSSTSTLPNSYTDNASNTGSTSSTSRSASAGRTRQDQRRTVPHMRYSPSLGSYDGDDDCPYPAADSDSDGSLWHNSRSASPRPRSDPESSSQSRSEPGSPHFGSHSKASSHGSHTDSNSGGAVSSWAANAWGIMQGSTRGSTRSSTTKKTRWQHIKEAWRDGQLDGWFKGPRSQLQQQLQEHLSGSTTLPSAGAPVTLIGRSSGGGSGGMNVSETGTASTGHPTRDLNTNSSSRDDGSGSDPKHSHDAKLSHSAAVLHDASSNVSAYSSGAAVEVEVAVPAALADYLPVGPGSHTGCGALSWEDADDMLPLQVSHISAQISQMPHGQQPYHHHAATSHSWQSSSSVPRSSSPSSLSPSSLSSSIGHPTHLPSSGVSAPSIADQHMEGYEEYYAYASRQAQRQQQARHAAEAAAADRVVLEEQHHQQVAAGGRQGLNQGEGASTRPGSATAGKRWSKRSGRDGSGWISSSSSSFDVSMSPDHRHQSMENRQADTGDEGMEGPGFAPPFALGSSSVLNNASREAQLSRHRRNSKPTAALAVPAADGGDGSNGGGAGSSTLGVGLDEHEQALWPAVRAVPVAPLGTVGSQKDCDLAGGNGSTSPGHSSGSTSAGGSGRHHQQELQALAVQQLDRANHPPLHQQWLHQEDLEGSASSLFHTVTLGSDDEAATLGGGPPLSAGVSRNSDASALTHAHVHALQPAQQQPQQLAVTGLGQGLAGSNEQQGHGELVGSSRAGAGARVRTTHTTSYQRRVLTASAAAGARSNPKHVLTSSSTLSNSSGSNSSSSHNALPPLADAAHAAAVTMPTTITTGVARGSLHSAFPALPAAAECALPAAGHAPAARSEATAAAAAAPASFPDATSANAAAAAAAAYYTPTTPAWQLHTSLAPSSSRAAAVGATASNNNSTSGSTTGGSDDGIGSGAGGRSRSSRSDMKRPDRVLSGHVIVAGAEESFVEFARVLHACSGLTDPENGMSSLPLVVIHNNLAESTLLALGALGPVQVVHGTPSDPTSLIAASADKARCLVYLGNTDRPTATGTGGGNAAAVDEHAQEYGATSRAAVLADAEALLTCYGVGEDVHRAANAPSLAHSVVELSYTSSVRYLQPGLLLQGATVWNMASCARAEPRRSWQQRLEAEEAAGDAGLVEWQANIYYCAGRVVVPALLDTFICQAIHKKSLLLDFMDEISGDDGRPGGALLRQLPVPPGFGGRPYRDLFMHVLQTYGALPLGLYRSKPENPAWRLNYVSLNPAWADVVSSQDRVFVLRDPNTDPIPAFM